MSMLAAMTSTSDLSTLVICDRWTMPIGRQNESSEWFVDWVLRKRAESSRHVTAGFAAYRAARDAYPKYETFASAAEYFGGMGCQSLMIQDMFRPAKHTVMEKHPLAAAHLQSLLGARPGVTVVEGDAYASHHPADIVGLDFGNLTIHQAQTKMKPLLDRVFADQPKAIVLTDIAGARLHLQRDKYQRLLNHDCSTYDAYLKGLTEYLRGVYGYQAVRCYRHRWSAVMALVPAARGGSLVLEDVPENPEGIRLR